MAIEDLTTFTEVDSPGRVSEANRPVFFRTGAEAAEARHVGG